MEVLDSHKEQFWGNRSQSTDRQTVGERLIGEALDETGTLDVQALHKNQETTPAGIEMIEVTEMREM